MGTINHDAVIATTCDEKSMERVRRWVLGVANEHRDLFAFTQSLTNGYQTVVLTPDGSKEGWDASNMGNTLRQSFIDLLSSIQSSDDLGSFDWVEVSFGEYGQKIKQGNNLSPC